MRSNRVFGAVVAMVTGGLVACQNAQVDAVLGTAPGQLFCVVQPVVGPAVTVAVQAAVAGALPGAGPVAVVVTGMAATWVQDRCQEAAAATGAYSGLPVSPPKAPVPTVTIKG